MRTCQTCAYMRLDNGIAMCTEPSMARDPVGGGSKAITCANGRAADARCGPEGALWFGSVAGSISIPPVPGKN